MRSRVLFVDDSDADVQLLMRRLRRDGVEFDGLRAGDESSLRAALAGQARDIVLVDHNVPGFSGLGAMRVIAEVADGAGTRYDPDFVAACVPVVRERGFVFSE